MEHKNKPTHDTIDQIYARGLYETSPTSTEHLTAELLAQGDVNKLQVDFDNGLTPVRDVGHMSTAQREAILDAYREGRVEETFA